MVTHNVITKPYKTYLRFLGVLPVKKDDAAMKRKPFMIEMFHEFTFEAAHRTTPTTPLHGHTFKVKVVLTGEPVPVFGWSHDLLEVEPVIAGVRKQLDHTYLNDIHGLDTPTLENVAQWIWKRLDSEIEGVDRVEVRRGLEGSGEGVVYRGTR